MLTELEQTPKKTETNGEPKTPKAKTPKKASEVRLPTILPIPSFPNVDEQSPSKKRKIDVAAEVKTEEDSGELKTDEVDGEPKIPKAKTPKAKTPKKEKEEVDGEPKTPNAKTPKKAVEVRLPNFPSQFQHQ